MELIEALGDMEERGLITGFIEYRRTHLEAKNCAGDELDCGTCQLTKQAEIAFKAGQESKEGKMAKKCPLFFIGHTMVLAGDETGTHDCIKEECAWWKFCSRLDILATAIFALQNIAMELHKINEEKPCQSTNPTK